MRKTIDWEGEGVTSEVMQLLQSIYDKEVTNWQVVAWHIYVPGKGGDWVGLVGFSLITGTHWGCTHCQPRPNESILIEKEGWGGGGSDYCTHVCYTCLPQDSCSLPNFLGKNASS